MSTLTDTPQGDTSLLEDPTAQRLLTSTETAHLAYLWPDGTPRCTAIWFHWNGAEVVVASPANAPKAAVIETGQPVAVTIDCADFPYTSLNLRGRAAVDRTSGVAPEYRLAAIRYFGPEQGAAWCDQLGDIDMVRVKLAPEWVGLIDLEDFRRLPSALAG